MKPLQRWECTDESCDFYFLVDRSTANAKHLSCPWCGNDAESTAQQDQWQWTKMSEEEQE